MLSVVAWAWDDDDDDELAWMTSWRGRQTRRGRRELAEESRIVLRRSRILRLSFSGVSGQEGSEEVVRAQVAN